MKTIGIKISAEEKGIDRYRWVGYWCYTNSDDYIRVSTNIYRSSRLKAEQDAILDAKHYAVNNNIAFITEGYQI